MPPFLFSTIFQISRKKQAAIIVHLLYGKTKR